jgi:hypothetical protein
MIMHYHVLGQFVGKIMIKALYIKSFYSFILFC